MTDLDENGKLKYGILRIFERTYIGNEGVTIGELIRRVEALEKRGEEKWPLTQLKVRLSSLKRDWEN